MKIALRAGHSPNCLGAEGIISEYYSCYSIYSYLKILLEKQGHEVVDCNSCANSERTELSEGTNKANKSGADIFISLHMNAFNNSSAHGSEIYLYPSPENLDDKHKTTIRLDAEYILDRFVDMGFANRGVKYKGSLHDLKATVMPAMLIEICFVTSPDDVSIYKRQGAENVARVIASAFGKVDKVPVNAGGWKMLGDGLHYYDGNGNEIIHILDKDVKL